MDEQANENYLLSDEDILKACTCTFDIETLHSR